MVKLFGLGGSNASGKDTVGVMLAERHGYLFVSATDILRDEARKRGLPVEREVLRTISAEWRRARGLGVLIDIALELFNAEPGKYKGLAVASLRNGGEAKRVHELGGLVVWVDADPKVRYQRVVLANRGRTEEDSKTFEQFIAEEEAEMWAEGKSEFELSLVHIKESADINLLNNGNDIEAFKDDAEAEIGKSIEI